MGFHPVHRSAASGELLVEMVIKLAQVQKVDGDLGGVAYRAGVTLIATIDGRIRYIVAKPFHEARLAAIRAWVGDFDLRQGAPWTSLPRHPHRLLNAFSLRAMDQRMWG